MNTSRLRNMLRSRELHKKWVVVFLVLAVLVTASVAAVLHRTGIAAVYTKRVLACPYGEMSGLIAHSHTTDCFDEEGNLICPLQEIQAHTHTEDCYTEQRTLICGLEENPGHMHDESCYTLTRGDLLCTDESEDHEHTDACYEMVPVLSCGMQEGEGAHTHDDSCYDIQQIITCGQQELPEHVHDASCFKEVELTEQEMLALGFLGESPSAAPEAGDETAEEQSEKLDEAMPGEVGSSDEQADGEVNENNDDIDGDERKQNGEPADDVTDENNNGDKLAGQENNNEEDQNEDAAAEETGAEVIMPAISFEETAGDVRVIVEADEGVFPEGATMTVEEVVDDVILDVVSGAVDGKVMQVKAVDITFKNVDGEEIQPAKPIRVRMEPINGSEINAAAESAKTAENEDFQVVHVDAEGNSEVVEPVGELTEEEAVIAEQENATFFEAEHFSVYAMVYTVHFEYEVDGQIYTSGVSGAEDKLLSDIIRDLHIVPEEEVGPFLSKISNVTITDPEVLKITAENGDWTIRPMKNAEVPESLQISMQDGAVFSIQVVAEGITEVSTTDDTAVISTVNDFYLPEKTAAYADLLDEETSEAAITAVQNLEEQELLRQSAPEGPALEAGYLAFDIGLENVDAETYPDGFEVTLKLPDGVTGRDFRLFHIHNDTVEELELNTEIARLEDGTEQLSSVHFVTPSFSEFVLSYRQITQTIVTASGETYEITVLYDETAEIPDGAKLQVREILPEDEEYADYFERAKEATTPDFLKSGAEKNEEDALNADSGNSGSMADEADAVGAEDADQAEKTEEYGRFFDIEIWADGQKIEPKSSVKVSIRLINTPDMAKATPKVVHFGTEGPELMELITGSDNGADGQMADTGSPADEFCFMTEEFSVYSVIYTVDFSFEINGKQYDFSLEGGDSTSFRELLEKFEILDKEDAERFIGSIEKVEFTNEEYLWNGKLEKPAFAGDLKKEHHLDVQYASNIQPGNIIAMNAHHYSTPDWVLIALKPFTSEEELTVTLKTGEVFTILVTDAQSDAIHNPDGTVQTVPNPQGTTFDLFNYYVSADTKTTSDRDQWPGHIHNLQDRFQFNWYNLDGTYAASWNDGWSYDDNWRNSHLLGNGNNMGINEGHAFKFTPAMAGTVIDGTKGTKSVDGDAGGLNSWTEDADPRQGIVVGTLINGYPQLSSNNALGTDGSSLAYLFDSTSVNGKDSYSKVNHLLYVDPEGYYTYDSRDFKAYIQPDGNIVVSDQPDTDDTELKGFWPFGDQVFWVGMHMNTQFSMPANGQVLNPNNELKDMQFEFSGDDDTWLYVDGVLVGDGGGIHNRTEIDVNFATGKVIVTGQKDTVHTGTFYQEQWLDDLFKNAGKYNDADWEEIPGTDHKRFKAGTYHTFDMFYLERGGGESNLYIHYNLVSTDDFTGHKSYEGFAENERMSRDQFKFEMIGLDGQYQSVWNPETQTATVSLIDEDGHAIMPTGGTENGAGTFGDPKKVHSESAYVDSNGNTRSGTVYTTGVVENGDIRFGSANISADEMSACDQGHPSLYRYVIREIVPDDAVNEEGVTWADATDEQKAAGGFVKDQVKYDYRTYYMTARVTSWDQTGADGNIYKAYGLSKTYYTDDTFTEVDDTVSFVDFRNLYAPDIGEVEFTKLDGSGDPLQGAEFTLYTDSGCTKIAKDLGDPERGIAGTDQVKNSGEDGKVAFVNMAAPRTYYMKETQVPPGYAPNNTVYKVIIENSKDETKSSRIVVVGDEEETPVTKIYNTKPGEISVVKEWQNANGAVVDGGNHTARVKIQRYHYQEGAASVPHSVTFTIKIENRDDLIYTYTADSIVGSTVSIDWWDTNQPINSIIVTDSNSGVMESQLSGYWDEQNHKNRKLTINGIISDVNVTVTYPSNVDWLFSSEHTPWMRNVAVAGSGPSYDLAPDQEFNASTDATHFAILASPDWSKTWTIGSGKDFPSVDGAGRPFRYYVVEVGDDGNPSEIGVVNDQGYKLIGYSVNNAEGILDQGTVVVYNQLEAPTTVDIVIKKYAKDDLVNESAETLAGATFRLEKYTSSAYQEKDSSWEEQSIADTESSGVFNFSNVTAGYYKIVEVTSPDGYVKITSDPTFEVRAVNGELKVIFTDTDLVKYSLEKGFLFGNEPGVALPMTGGPGTALFTALGGLMTAMAGAFLIIRRKKTA